MNNKTKKILITSLLSLVLFLISFFIIQKYKKFNNDIKDLSINTKCNKNMNCRISTQYNRDLKEVKISVTDLDQTIDYWQTEILKNVNPLVIELYLCKNKNFKEQKFSYTTLNASPKQILSIYFNKKDVSIQNYVNLKQQILTNAENNKISVILPDVLGNDIRIKNSLKQRYLQQKKEEERREEEKLYVQNMTYYYNQDKVAVPFENTDFRKCLFKVNGTCFGQPFYAKGMSYMDCKSERSKLGIKECSASKDIWATTVKICGGVNNLPSAKDLRLLASDLYGQEISNKDEINPQSLNSRIIGITGEYQRNNSKSYLNYFRDTYWRTNSFDSGAEEQMRREFPLKIYSNQETGSYTAAARILDNNYTEYGIIDRDNDGNMSICKAR